MTFYWTADDGDTAALANRFKKAGQLNVTVVDDTVGMTPFEAPAQLSNFISNIQQHFRCTLVGTDGDDA